LVVGQQHLMGTYQLHLHLPLLLLLIQQMMRLTSQLVRLRPAVAPQHTTSTSAAAAAATAAAAAQTVAAAAATTADEPQACL
jgi:hypothetical protein